MCLGLPWLAHNELGLRVLRGGFSSTCSLCITDTVAFFRTFGFGMRVRDSFLVSANTESHANHDLDDAAESKLNVFSGR
jgi:hypothetical protein